MFTSSLEGDRKDIVIHGITSSIMNQIIDYAYLSKCNLTMDNVFEVFVASDYVAMLDLLNRCKEFLISKLEISNCIVIMLFGK